MGKSQIFKFIKNNVMKEKPNHPVENFNRMEDTNGDAQFFSSPIARSQQKKSHTHAKSILTFLKKNTLPAALKNNYYLNCVLDDSRFHSYQQ